MSIKNSGSKKFLIVLVSIIVIVCGFYFINNKIYQNKQSGGAVVEAYKAILSGVQTCLPHRDTTGPQTLECAIGMQTDAGEYYVLDLTAVSQIPEGIESGKRFTASGIVTPIELLSTDQRQKYDVVGIFSVTDSLLVEQERKVVFNWRFESADTLNGDGNPNTNVFLDAKYSDGEVVSKLVQVSHASCNELPENDLDTLAGTKNVQCYGAGFGFTFKIVKGENSYEVMKKEFEEGSPDYNPPVQKYEAVDEFPL